jgi:hypothetical protein
MSNTKLTYEQWKENYFQLLADQQVVGSSETPYMIEMGEFGISQFLKDYPEHSARYLAE